PTAYQDLLSKRLDAVVQGRPPLKVLIKERPNQFKILAGLGPRAYYGAVVRKGDTALLEYVNGQIRKFKQDGTLKALQAKWLGEPAGPRWPARWTRWSWCAARGRGRRGGVPAPAPARLIRRSRTRARPRRSHGAVRLRPDRRQHPSPPEGRRLHGRGLGAGDRLRPRARLAARPRRRVRRRRVPRGELGVRPVHPRHAAPRADLPD